MKIPKTLKIGGFMWKIHQNQHVSNEGNSFGSTHTRHQNIFIEPSETQQKKEHTLLHEVMHALWWQTGLSSRYKEDKKIEEEVIDAISSGLYQVLKDNKMLK